MRKDKEQQQIDFSPPSGEDGQPGHFTHSSGTGKGMDSGVELSSRLEKQRTLTATLLDKILDYENLANAHQRVVANRGSSGVDKMEVEELGVWLNTHLNTLRTALLTEQYQVSAVRKVEIPKPTGGVRILGIPTVKDRYIQQAISQVLNRYYDPYFSDHSYGFRSGRSAADAIRQSSLYVQSGKEWVVDIDLEKFFDKINHDRLMQRLSKGLGDKRVLRLINAYLKAGLMSEGLLEQRTSGTPQGGPLSPLLSNIVLDELDKELENRGHSFCRYADDCNIYVTSRKAGERVLVSITKFIEKKLKLKVNSSKSGVRHCSDTTFLGYTLLSGGGIRVSDRSVKRLKDKIREVTLRSRGISFYDAIKETNRIIIGWSNYFRLANKWLKEISNIESWIRRKLRCYKLRQCGGRYTMVKFLMSLGSPETPSWQAVMYTQGWWELCSKVVVSRAMGIDWFTRQGLQSLYKRMQC